MSAVIDAVYENGVFRPLVRPNLPHLKEHQQYRLTLNGAVSSSPVEELNVSPELAAEIERRTTILPDGRKIIRVGGLFKADLSGIPDDQDPVADALAEFRLERSRHFDEQWPELDEQVSESR